MLKIISHDPKCDPCVRCTCGAEPVPVPPAVFTEYIELSDSTVIVTSSPIITVSPTRRVKISILTASIPILDPETAGTGDMNLCTSRVEY